MKITTKLFCLFAAIFLISSVARAQQSKENFERRKQGSTNIFGKLFSTERKENKKGVSQKMHSGKLSANPTEWNRNQRLQAEQIWLKQREFRAKQREKLKNRKPTAWELTYFDQEKQRQKELRKLLKAKDKRIAARAKSRKKAMLAAAKYKNKKLKHTTSQKQRPVFSSGHFAVR